MNPVVVSLAFGLCKGLVLARYHRSDKRFEAMVTAPLIEEATYRGPLALMPGRFPRGMSALSFALAHVEARAPIGFSAWRLAETFLGGLLYESALRRFGFLGAVIAHAAHNIGCDVGATLSGGRRSVAIPFSPQPERMYP
jgi:membrane protease YdiL (CAAX protease family)